MQSDLFPTKRLHRRGDMFSTSALEENRFGVTFGVNQGSPDDGVAQSLGADRDTDGDTDQGNAKDRIGKWTDLAVLTDQGAATSRSGNSGVQREDLSAVTQASDLRGGYAFSADAPQDALSVLIVFDHIGIGQSGAALHRNGVAAASLLPIETLPGTVLAIGAYGANPDGAPKTWGDPVGFAAAISPAAAPLPTVITRVSVASDGTQGNDQSLGASLSADGRFVVFYSLASNLVAGDTNGNYDIFVRDLSTGSTARVSVASDGAQGNHVSFAPHRSADGRFVMFVSYASNLVAGDTNGALDIFVRDLLTGSTARVSVASDGTQGNDESLGASLSADGRFVVFDSYASNLVAGDTNGTSDIFVRDLSTGTTTRVSVASDGTQGNDQSYAPHLSADGRFVVFYSLASNLVAGDTNGAYDIFVRDLLTGSTARVSVASDGTQGNSNSARASLSADGRFVVFESQASNLVAGDTNASNDIFVRDLLTGTTTRVSVASDGTQGNSGSEESHLSADGRFVVFESPAATLVAGDTNGAHDIFVRDLLTGSTARVSVASDGTQGNGHSSSPTLSADGRFITFDSGASNLVADDTSGTYDVFTVANPLFGAIVAQPWSFSYTNPADMLTFAHLSADSYNGDLPGISSGGMIRPPAGWTAILTTWDGLGAVPTDDAGNAVATITVSAAGMQATAYREDATGRVVISYRGTDGEGELAGTSIPLGLGDDEPTFLGFPVQTSSYMQSAVDFYAAVVGYDPAQGTTAVAPDLIAFTGHSLGGMLAGYMAGLTGAQAMVFASGPHSELMQYLNSGVARPTDVGLLTGSVDYSGLVHARIDGEILGEAVQAAIDGSFAAFVQSALSGNVAIAALSGLALLRWGDATFEGTNLAPMISGLPQTWPNANSLHSMPLHMLVAYADYSLGLTEYKSVSGFLWSFFDDDLALSASQAVGNLAFIDMDAGRMFSDMVLAIDDRTGGLENVLLPLLNDADQVLARLDAAGIGLGVSIASPLRSLGFETRVIEAISAHFVETAARALMSDGVGGINYVTAQGMSILGLASEVGITGEWLRLSPHSFTTVNATQGILDLQATIMRAMGLDVPTAGLVSLASDISILLNPDAGQTMTGSARNDLVIGAVDSGGGGVWISGLGGNDVLVGTSGNDSLYGGSGQNYLVGGTGNDLYVASAIAGSQTVVSDLGGQDQLTVQGAIVGYSRQSGFAYITNDLSLEIGGQGATVSILDHYFTRLLDGIGRIERIVNSDGTVWRPTTIVEQAFGVLRHVVNSVVAGTTALVTAAVDAVDQVVGTIAEYGTRLVQAVGAGIEDTFRFLENSFSQGDAVIRAILPINRLAALVPGDATTHVIDIDANSDGIVDASITLLGSYVGLGLSVTTDGADTIIRLTLDPALQFDITGDDIMNDTLTGSALAEKIGGLGGNDSLSGLAGDDTLMGGAGNDRLTGGSGVDRMFGGLGNDLYVVSEVDDIVIEFFGEGTDTISASVSYELLTPVENLVLTGIVGLNGTGNSLDNRITGNGAANRLNGLDGHDTILAELGNDTVDGGAGNDSLYGGDGNDLLTGGIGNDRIDGGLGSDRAYFTGTTAATVNLSLITAQVTGFGTDTLLGIEHLSSGSDNDRLTGNTLGNSLISGAGNDTVDGGAGNDALYGGDGNDLLTGGIGNDRIDGGLGSDRAYFTGATAATVNLSLITAQVTGFGTDTLLGIEHLSSGSGNDRLTGDTLGNSLISGAGNDTVDGGAGNDALYGGDGNDLMFGGIGNDRIDGGLGSDRAYFTGTAAATVNLSLITAQVTGFGTDTLLGIEHLSSGSGNDRLTGDTLGNSLISGAGNDTVDGGAGNDALYGGDGNDLMVGSLGNDRIDGGLGSDRAYFTGTFTATVNLSILTAQVTGYGTDTLTGIEHLSSGSGNDTLTGDAFSNSLVSGAGNDTVNGGAGNDAFYGGAGNDLLSGGAGNDRFSYAAQSEAGDRVSDFIATDDSFVFQAIGFNVFQAGSFSNLAIGSLNAASFRVGSTNIAADGNDFFIFRSTDTTLWFDADGNGAQRSAILIVDLQTGATMSATDVLLI